MTGEVAIRIRGVSHQFGEEGDARYVCALRDTSLDVARGELLCLIGPSGCGKSTLLNVIGGLMTPTAGAVEVAGKRVAGPMPHDIAFVFQENALFPWNTVFENVNLGMVFQGVPRAEREARAQRALEAVGLKDFAQHYPGQLSGGMRQRAALARALSLETGILLMDEPFGALDEQTRMILGEDLSVLLARADKTIVFVTHSLGEATFLADRVAVFSARPGTIKEIIKVDEPHPRKPDFVTSAKFTASRAVQATFLITLVALWYLATTRWRVSPLLLPNPVAVLRDFWDILKTGEFIDDLRVTLTELAAAFAIAASCGVVVGYLISRSQYRIRVFEPLFAGIYSVPIILFLPLYVLFFGLGPASKIALGATIGFFPIALQTIAGFGYVDRMLVTAARSMGASDYQLFRYVLLPAAWPVVLTGMRMGFTVALLSIIGSETIASLAGLGHRIVHLAESMEMARMFAYIVFVVMIALILNTLVSMLETRGKRLQ